MIEAHEVIIKIPKLGAACTVYNAMFDQSDEFEHIYVREALEVYLRSAKWTHRNESHIIYWFDGKNAYARTFKNLLQMEDYLRGLING